MATIETRTKQEKRAHPQPLMITPEPQPITWKPWPEVKSYSSPTTILFPPHGGLFHITNGKE